MRRRLAVVAVVFALSGCSFIDDFSRFHTDAGAMDAAADGPAEDVGPVADLGHALALDEFLAMYGPRACALALYCESKLGLGALVEFICHPELARELATGGISSGPTPLADVGFDPVAAQQCLDDLGAALAGGMDCSVSSSFLPPSCDRVAHGARGDGSTCRADAQCASGRCDTTDSCGGTCVPLGGPSAACTASSDCQPTLRCDGTMCVAVGASHDACMRSGQCGASLWCSSTTHTCEALPDSGGTCETSLGGDPCRGMLVCTGAFGAQTCVDGVAAMGACDLDHPCQPGLRCSGTVHTCKPIAQPGGTCSSAENCPYFFVCTGGHCNPGPLLGEPCNPLDPCIIGACTGPAGSTTCTLLPDSAACAAASDPCMGYCDVPSLHCAHDLADGVTCGNDEQCVPTSACLAGPTGPTCMACAP